ncbi:MAG TPA: hypothetical protein VEX70_14570 [Pyrinomonadaceae bacterium]|nr:hypothetical protein [Pyrinomonadaceae bacterium]
MLFAASFALTPFVVFNQQVLTGLSLQPIHYKVFTLNYVAPLAFFLTVALIRQELCAATVSAGTARPGSVSRVLAACIVSAAYAVALFDTVRITRQFTPTNFMRDEQVRVARRMKEIGRADDAPVIGQQQEGRRVALVTSYMLSDSLPIIAPQAVLWSPHMLVSSGLTASGHKERIYQYLYYTGVAPQDFPRFVAANRFIIYMLFSPDRALPYLTNAHAPLTAGEIDGEARAYAAYVAAFTRDEAARPTLSYVITSPERPHDLA